MTRREKLKKLWDGPAGFLNSTDPEHSDTNLFHRIDVQKKQLLEAFQMATSDKERDDINHAYYYLNGIENYIKAR
jgi:hypothetical protein